jgi:hypothetical protein
MRPPKAEAFAGRHAGHRLVPAPAAARLPRPKSVPAGSIRPRLVPQTTVSRTVCGQRHQRSRAELRVRRASFKLTTSRSWCALANRVASHPPGPRPKSRSFLDGDMQYVREIGSSSGPFSPREFVAPRRVFMPSDARCSPGFSTSPGLPPSSPWAGASTSPPLTGLARDAAPEGASSFIETREPR